MNELTMNWTTPTIENIENIHTSTTEEHEYKQSNVLLITIPICRHLSWIRKFLRRNYNWVLKCNLDCRNIWFSSAKTKK